MNTTSINTYYFYKLSVFILFSYYKVFVMKLMYISCPNAN